MTIGLTRQRLGELPAEVTGFVGRQRELAGLTGLLRTARLVTVSGPGGVGKTRLALRAAAQLSAEFTDGTCLVELSGLSDAGLLPSTVATGLGLPESQARSHLDAILDHLRDRKLLLILDTCEHLLDACAKLADVLLRATPGVAMLATSRQPLDVPGEHTCALPPLPAESAIELFAQCAATAVPGFAVTDGNRADVAKLCERLDGLPLAIELAAVRLRALSPAQLASRLEDRFRLLAGGPRAALPHHQTLRTATEWSHDLCTPKEQLLWARLSVFAGSFDVRGAEQVCGAPPLAGPELVTTLIGLVNKSVVLRAGDRYRLLDTIREFGAEKLTQAGSAAALRGRHVGHYLVVARELGRAGLPRHDELRREQDNLRAALDYALATPGRDRDAAAMTAALYAYWQRSGSLSEGRYWMAKILARFPGPSAERAWALVVDGYLAASQGDVTAAIAELKAAVVIADEIGEARAGAHAHLHLNIALGFASRYEEAIAEGLIAEEHARAAGDTAWLTTLDAQMAHLHIVLGDANEGISRARQGLERLKGLEGLEGETGAPWQQSYLHSALGLGYFMTRDFSASSAALAAALEMKLAIGDILGMGYPLECAAWVAAAQGRYGRAAWLLGAADRQWRTAGGRLGRNARLEALHSRAEHATRMALGQHGYDTLSRRGAEHPLDQIVRLAVTNASNFPALSEPAESAGHTVLTSREGEIVELVAQGLTNREIASRLIISKRTVDAHIEHIFGKLGVSSRVQLVNWMKSSLERCVT